MFLKGLFRRWKERRRGLIHENRQWTWLIYYQGNLKWGNMELAEIEQKKVVLQVLEMIEGVRVIFYKKKDDKHARYYLPDESFDDKIIYDFFTKHNMKERLDTPFHKDADGMIFVCTIYGEGIHDNPYFLSTKNMVVESIWENFYGRNERLSYESAQWIVEYMNTDEHNPYPGIADDLERDLFMIPDICLKGESEEDPPFKSKAEVKDWVSGQKHWPELRQLVANPSRNKNAPVYGVLLEPFDRELAKRELPWLKEAAGFILSPKWTKEVEEWKTS